MLEKKILINLIQKEYPKEIEKAKNIFEGLYYELRYIYNIDRHNAYNLAYIGLYNFYEKLKNESN